MKFLSAFLLSAVFVCGQDLQNRTITKFTTDFSQRWYGVGWVIGNGRMEAPNNVNVFGGIGYKRPSWWFETMFWKQWSVKTGSTAIDFRFQKQFKDKSTLYIEQSPFLSRRAFYHFIIYEHPFWNKTMLGAETENLLQPGRNSVGGGPRISRVLGKIGAVQVTTTLSYRFRHEEKDELRLYVVFRVPLRVWK